MLIALYKYVSIIKNWIVCLTLLLCPYFLLGQSVEIRNITFPRGRSLSMITDMDQDDLGYIWMTTQNDGLVKFNGVDLQSINLDRSSFGGSELECLHIDRGGMIWVGSKSSGLFMIDPITNVQTHYEHQAEEDFSLSDNIVSSILEDTAGTLWVGTSKGLDTLDRTTGRFYKVTGKNSSRRLGDEHIRAIYEDSDHTIWIGCGDATQPSEDSELGGLYKIDKNSKNIIKYVASPEDQNSLINPNVRAIFEDSRGVFWVGTAGDGLHTFDRSKEKFTRHPYKPEDPSSLSRPNYDPEYTIDHITFINEDLKGFIWIGTLDGGLNRYDPEKDLVSTFGPNQEGEFFLDRKDHWASLRTDDGDLWISDNWISQSSANQRILDINSGYNNQIFYNRLEGYALSLTEDDSGTLWVATNVGLFRRNEDGTHDMFKVNQLEENSRDNIMFYVIQGPKNTLYIATQSGIQSFDTKREEFSRLKLKHFYFGLFYDTDDILWAVSQEGFVRIDPSTMEETIYTESLENPTPNFVTWVLDDDAGYLWMATDLGLLKYDKNTLTYTSHMRDENVSFMSIDEHGIMWVVGPNKLFTFNMKDKSYVEINDSTHFLNETISTNTRVVFGINETLWIEKPHGLVHFDPETEIGTFHGSSWFDPNYLIRPGSLRHITGNKLALCAGFGYYLMPEVLVNQEQLFPKPFLSHLKTSDQNISLYQKGNVQIEKFIQLSSSENDIEMEFDNVDLVSFDNEINLQYKLENYDTEWRSANRITKASFYDLPPGEYVFKLRAANKYGSVTEVQQAIKINPPWFKTIWAYLLYAFIFGALIFVFDKFMRNRLVQREREKSLEKELKQAKEIEKAYNELQATQSQLIQSEKMASLGELTAGIAHEIQNPLNFVNNFSEVSNELIDEMIQEIENNDLDEVRTIANDVKQNLDKINHHGKRADGIVKGMLQHSRSSNGKKEPIDINKLADEYLRLAYHGLRAKDKSFNASLKTDFDESIGKINVSPQDMGRVILNLITNAFYAVDEKKKASEENYEPTVSVSTKEQDNKIEIKVTDNGNGIPKKVLAKIFQPFFTTKPTGKGTGLGLSLSYDIVKVHGGELKVNTKSGEGTEFTIILPNS